MIAVAIASGILRVILYTRGMWYESDRAWYQSRADSFATDEESALQRVHRDREAIAEAQAKVRAMASWHANVGRRPVGPFPVLDRDEQAYLRMGQAMTALHLRQARYFSEMKRKYMHAASVPWEPVPPDPASPR